MASNIDIPVLAEVEIMQDGEHISEPEEYKKNKETLNNVGAHRFGPFRAHPKGPICDQLKGPIHQCS